MNKRLSKNKLMILLCMILTMAFALVSFASDDDNSLAGLGIRTDGVTVSPDFEYSTWNYNVTMPEGVRKLDLAPQPSSSTASIADISVGGDGSDGTGSAVHNDDGSWTVNLEEDGSSVVTITVQSGNGSQFPYTLNVTSTAGAAAEPATEAQSETKAETEKQTEAETEPATEDSQFVKVDRNALEEAEKTITDLKEQITANRTTISQYTKIIYGLIAVSIVLLFVVINLILRKKDLKAELNEYRRLGYAPKSQKKNGKKEGGGNGNGGNYPGQGPAGGAPEASSGSRKAAPSGGSEAQQRPMKPKNAGNRVNGTEEGPLDVEPQQSHKLRRQVPSYETGPANAQNMVHVQSTAQGTIYGTIAGAGQNKNNAKQSDARTRKEPANAAVPSPDRSSVPQKPSEGGKDVKVDMIDL